MYKKILSIGLIGSMAINAIHADLMQNVIERATLIQGEIPSKPSVSEFKKNADGAWRIYINGVETPIRGAGGVLSPGMLEHFKESGGNFTRTWGGDSLEQIVAGGERYIDRAYRLGIHVMPGLWIGHERHGFDYSDPKAIEAQRKMVRETVRKYKNHPAVVMWGLGNEMEDPVSQTGKAIIFKELNHLAAIIKEEDPHHPVMTIIAGKAEKKVKNIMKYYPNIDALGVNSYGAAAGTGEALVSYGWNKPFAITEFGVRGFWEVGKTAWGAPIEPNSTEKARTYYATHKLVYEMNEGKELCLGTFAFLWGWKQECTATWFGMALPTFEKLPQVDAMVKAWTDEWPDNRCPTIKKIKASFHSGYVSPNQILEAEVIADDPEGETMSYEWLVVEETKTQSVGGDYEAGLPSFPELTLKNNLPVGKIKAPAQKGPYRLFLTIKDGQGGAATANIPFMVR